MGLRSWLKRLERASREDMVEIPQIGSGVERFSQRQAADAYLEALDRECGMADPEEPEHPLSLAARNSSDPWWRNSAYVADLADEPAKDLSE